MQQKQAKRSRRHERVRAKIFGTSEKPRLYVFKSAKHIYAQLIDDEKGVTLASASDLELTSQSRRERKTKVSRKTDAKPRSRTSSLRDRQKHETDAKILSGKIAIAFGVGKLIAEKALKNKIEKIIFDRGGYKYHGRIKALAEGAREGGLKF